MSKLVRRNEVPLARRNTTPRRYDPFGTLSGWSLFDDFFDLGLMLPELRAFSGARSSSMPVDIYEDGADIVVKADIPGVSKEDICVELVDGGVNIKYEKEEEHEEDTKGYYRKERSYASQSRFVALPHDGTAEDIKGDYSDGVLTLTVPKPEIIEEEKPKEIKITIE